MYQRYAHKAFIVALSLAIVFSVLFILFFLKILPQQLIHSFDYKVDNMVSPLRQFHSLAQIMLIATYFGNPEIIIAFEICLLVFIFLVHRKRIALLFLAAILTAEGISLFLKNLLQRARPAETIFHVSRIGYSFPSGHALLGMMFYGGLGFFIAHLAQTKTQKKIIVSISAIIIFLIGFSRVYLGVHWASDVVAGWLIGGAVLSAMIGSFYLIHHHLKGDKIKTLRVKERVSLIVVSSMVSIYVIFFFVTHIAEIRSIV